jgi:ABC-type antimicrobial peptide transport system permease subunit
MALGARSRDVLRLVLGQSLKLCGIGLAIAVPLTITLARVMKSLVFSIVSLSPEILAGFALLLVTVSVAAGYIPARQAAGLDPLTALRYE